MSHVKHYFKLTRRILKDERHTKAIVDIYHYLHWCSGMLLLVMIDLVWSDYKDKFPAIIPDKYIQLYNCIVKL